MFFKVRKVHRYNRDKLMENSLVKLSEMFYEEEAYFNKDEVILIANCISFMDEIFYKVDYEEKNQLKKIEFICPLPKSRVGRYGEIIEISNDKYGLYLSPYFRNNSTLTPYERTRLYFFREAFNVIHKPWVSDARDMANKLVQAKIVNKNQSLVLCEGINLLDETTSQEMAEELAYAMANKARPVIRNIDFCGVELVGNFDIYDEFQQIAGKFAQTLRGIGKFDNTIYALNLLAKRANKSNFINEIIEEYVKDENFLKLIELLIRLGEVKLAPNNRLGMGEMSVDQVHNLFMETMQLSESLRDWQEKEF